MTALVLRGDARRLPLPDASVDAIVCDPPYGLAELPTRVVETALREWLTGRRDFVPDGRGFMSRDWDRFVPPPAAWDEAYRVLKPGGHLLAFAGARTVDLMGMSIRLAGFEQRDSVTMLGWVQAQGFPKSRNVSADIDAMAGAEREVLRTATRVTGSSVYDKRPSRPAGLYASAEYVVTAPATAAAARWQGWGTALKPAAEPILLARKPLPSTVAANVLAYGTGAINVDGCRVEHDAASAAWVERWSGHDGHPRALYGGNIGAQFGGSPAGRWPTNLVLVHHPDCAEVGTTTVRGDGHHPARRGAGGLSTSGHAGQAGLAERYAGDEVVPVMACVPGCPVAELDGQSGAGVSRRIDKPAAATPNAKTWEGGPLNGPRPARGFTDAGGASRFYPVFRFNPKADGWERPEVVLADGTVLRHPTVKPLDLMRWLVRMVTPPGGLVLDPFAGSGATLQAAEVEGFRAVGVELDPGHCALIRERLTWRIELDRNDRARRIRPKPAADPDQGDLWAGVLYGETAEAAS